MGAFRSVPTALFFGFSAKIMEVRYKCPYRGICERCSSSLEKTRFRFPLHANGTASPGQPTGVGVIWHREILAGKALHLFSEKMAILPAFAGGWVFSPLTEKNRDKNFAKTECVLGDPSYKGSGTLETMAGANMPDGCRFEECKA